MQKVVIIPLIVVLSLFFPLHSGKTDGNGGHYNSASGEYHYHHGYSAHYHYDMDGDGIIDCPYEFDDKTNHNNSSSNSSNKANNSTSIPENNAEKPKNKITFGKAVGIVLLSIIPLSLLTLCVLYVVLGLVCIIIWELVEKFFKVSIGEPIQQRIFHILLIIGFAIIVPLEILFILGIL